MTTPAVMRHFGGLGAAWLLVTACPGDDTAAVDTSSSESTGTSTESPSTSDADTTAEATTTESSSGAPDTSEESTDATTGTTCGNGELDRGEDCDGDDLGGADCISLGFLGGALACDGCDFDTSACEAADCGDGVIEGAEACDPPSLAGETCESQGFFAGTLQCADDCATFDTSGCVDSLCGNGTVEGSEVCESAALGDDCVGLGFPGGVLACAAGCMAYDTSGCFQCGDGEAEGDEACDGEDVGANTCIALGFTAGRPTCADDCTIASTDGCFGVHTYCVAPGDAIGPAPGFVASDLVVDGLLGAAIDVDVFVAASHGDVSQLQLAIEHVPSATAVTLLEGPCAGQNDVVATFDDDAGVAIDCVEPIAVEGLVAPVGDLDDLDGVIGPGNGTWRLGVTDGAMGEGGTLDQWCVSITNVPTAERFLYVANDTAPNAITGWSVATDGALTELAASPFDAVQDSGFDHHPDAIVACGDHVYVANYPDGLAGFGVADDGALSPVPGSPYPVPGVLGIACDADGYLFTSDFGPSVERFAIADDGSLTSLGAAEAGASTLGLTYHQATDRLFVAGWNAQLTVLDHDGAGGLSLAPGSPIATGGNNHSASVAPSGGFVAVEGMGAVAIFAVAEDGSLAEVPGSPFADPTPCETVGLAWAPDGTRLFVGHRGCAPARVMVFDVAPDGTLAAVAGAPFVTGGDSAVGLAVRFDGLRLFTSHADGTVGVLEVAPDGSLAPISGSPFVNAAAGGQPWLVLR